MLILINLSLDGVDDISKILVVPVSYHCLLEGLLGSPEDHFPGTGHIVKDDHHNNSYQLQEQNTRQHNMVL